MDDTVIKILFNSLKLASSLSLVLCLSLIGRREKHLVDTNWNLIILGFTLLTLSFAVDFLEGSLGAFGYSSLGLSFETLFAFSGMGLACFGLGRWFSIKQFAYYDRLTGLANRLELERCGPKLLEENPREGFAVLFMDLDGFKSVNDNYGHAYGDLLLKSVAQRLTRQTREGDKVFRLGGDEFVAIVNLNFDDDPKRIAERYLSLFNEPFYIRGKHMSISGSVGISLYPTHAKSIDELVDFADKAMYLAKRTGKNQIMTYDPTPDQALVTQELHKLLIDALDAGEFYLEYQPIFKAEDELYSLEALIRWRKESGERVSPEHFISLAESSGFIVPLGEWILDSVCETLSQLLSYGYKDIKVAVNVSAAQLAEPAFRHQLEHALSKYNVPAQMLEIEVTEGVVMVAQAIEQLTYLKRLGISIAMDDFGTGFSSLGNLHSLPFDIVKIDKTFVDQLKPFDNTQSLASTIIKLSHQLGKKTIAEGVETDEQLEVLKQMKCDLFQGYLFAKPLGMDRLLEYLKDFYPLDLAMPENKSISALN